MKLAVFTPTHNPRRLVAAARSLAAQTGVDVADVAWLVGVNGAAARDPDAVATINECLAVVRGAGIAADSIDISSHGSAIGALKRALCMNAIEDGADAVVELDHDDVLAPAALASIAQTEFEPGDRAFWYSDFAEFRDDTMAPHAYSSDFGWSTYPLIARAPGTDVDLAALVAMRAFPADARSLCQILYAPNHLRAWSAAAYLAADGHSPSLDVCDDHDLLIRTYLDTATRFVHLPDCLYYYRIADNTCAGEANARIQSISGCGNEWYANGQRVPDFAACVALRDQHLQALVEAEALRRRGSGDVSSLLDLGGAIGAPPGWRTVDLANADVICDLRNGLPFEDGSVFAIRAHDVLEHIDGDDAARLIGECWRVLCHGGWLLTRTPADNGAGAACDLSHRSRWNTRTWAYFWSGRLRPYRDAAFPDLVADFQPVRVFTDSTAMGPWPCRWEVPYVVADLQAVKPGGRRLPGGLFL